MRAWLKRQRFSLPAQRPLILFYNHFFKVPVPPEFIPWQVRPHFTWNHKYLKSANALVFHIPNLTWEKPVLARFLALKKPHGQLWVAWSMESAMNYPVQDDPEFMSRFDIVMDYRRRADIRTTYSPGQKKWADALAKNLQAAPEPVSMVMFQSSDINQSGRTAFIHELMEHMKIDSYGKFLNNRAIPKPDLGFASKQAVIARYKFCLSLENAIEPDYVTEKFFDPLLAGTVPVYRGAPNIADFVPGDDCFIDATKFASPAALAQYLQELAADDNAYQRFFAWRRRPLLPAFEAMLAAQEVSAFKRLVALVKQNITDS